MPSRGLLSRIAARLGWHVARRRTHQLVRRDYYSPLPDPEGLPDSTWDRPNALAGIELDTAAQIRFAESTLAPYFAEFARDLMPDGRIGRFEADNTYYASGDADLLYAMTRHLKPRRVIELGSGYSTLVLAHGIRRNAEEGSSAVLTAYDPHPSDVLGDRPPPEVELRSTPAQEVSLEEFDALGPDDMLFVDTSHTVKTGGEVNRVVLDVLPRFARGVVVHFHDVFLPWEYHRTWLDRGWNEQYLVQAFLAGNPDWEVVLALHHLTRVAPDAVRALAPRWTPGETFPSAFWIRRRSA
jgi:Methyltransferase domain